MKAMQTPFESYEFTAEEWPVAATFNDLQEKHIKTELAAFAMQKVNIGFSPETGPNAQLKFILESEYLRGACEALQHLLSVSEDERSALAAALQAQADKQQQS
jgi:hypothetical protein